VESVDIEKGMRFSHLVFRVIAEFVHMNYFVTSLRKYLI